METYFDYVLQRLRASVEQAVADPSKQHSRGSLAEALGLKTEKTLVNWLNKKHCIPLDQYIHLCLLLGIAPQELFPNCPRIDTFPRRDDPIKSERMLLSLEQTIPPGRPKRLMFPLWSSPLQLQPLTKLYCSKGNYVSFFHGDTWERFLEVRAQRRWCFEQGHYIMCHVMMRDEFEQFVNGDRLFRLRPSKPTEDEKALLTVDEKIGQIEHLISLLSSQGKGDPPRLQLRMTKSFLRLQFALFPSPEGGDVPVASSNIGHMRLCSAEVESFLQSEFSVIWEHGTHPGLRTADPWIQLLEASREYLVSNVSHNNARKETRRFYVGDILPPSAEHDV